MRRNAGQLCYKQSRPHDRESMMKQSHTSLQFGHRGRLVLPLVVLLGIMLSGAAVAQVYTWTDENGVVHYSDTPNAAGTSQEIADTEIYRPGSSDAYPTPTPPAPAADSGGGMPPDEAPAEPDLSPAAQVRADIAEKAAERREKQAETERLCALNRQRLEQMQPARRVMYTDAEGNEVRMDDDQRVALIEESEAYIKANCH